MELALLFGCNILRVEFDLWIGWELVWGRTPQNFCALNP